MGAWVLHCRRKNAANATAISWWEVILHLARPEFAEVQRAGPWTSTQPAQSMS